MKRRGRTHRPDNWMPLFIAEYLADTGRLTTEMHGAYFLLLLEYWRSGGPTGGGLPDDDVVLAQIARLDAKRWKVVRQVIGRLPFFNVTEGVWRQKRADEELTIAWENHAMAARRSAAGNAAKATRKDSGPETEKDAEKDAEMETDKASLKEADKVSFERPPSPSPSPNGLSAAPPARAPDRFDDDTEAVIEAAHADPSKQARWQMAPAALSRWRARGADLDLDIVPTIRERMQVRQARGQGPPDGPEYFDRAIVDAIERRLRPLPEPEILPPTGGRPDARSARAAEAADRRSRGESALADYVRRGGGPGG